MTPESLQYACDLLNRGRERTDSARPKCKVGKPCGGRCIPQSHKCLASGQANENEGERKGMHPAIKNGLKAAAIVGGASLAIGALGIGGIALAGSLRNKGAEGKNSPETEEALKNNHERHEAIMRKSEAHRKEMDDLINADPKQHPFYKKRMADIHQEIYGKLPDEQPPIKKLNKGPDGTFR